MPNFCMNAGRCSFLLDEDPLTLAAPIKLRSGTIVKRKNTARAKVLRCACPAAAQVPTTLRERKIAAMRRTCGGWGNVLHGCFHVGPKPCCERAWPFDLDQSFMACIPCEQQYWSDTNTSAACAPWRA